MHFLFKYSGFSYICEGKGSHESAECKFPDFHEPWDPCGLRHLGALLLPTLSFPGQGDGGDGKARAVPASPLHAALCEKSSECTSLLFYL